MRVQRNSTSSDPHKATKRATGAGTWPVAPRVFLANTLMSDPTPTNPYTRRWHALLADNEAIQNEHLELISAFSQPFSREQLAQLDASTARLQKLSLKLHDLVDEWAADARST